MVKMNNTLSQIWSNVIQRPSMQRNSKSGHGEACAVLTKDVIGVEVVVGFECLVFIVIDCDVSFDGTVDVVDNTFLVAMVGKVPRNLFGVLEYTFSESDVTSTSWLS